VLPGRLLALARWPQQGLFVVLAPEMASTLLWAERGLATKRRAAREASRAPLPEREVFQQALAVLVFSKRYPSSRGAKEFGSKPTDAAECQHHTRLRSIEGYPGSSSNHKHAIFYL